MAKGEKKTKKISTTNSVKFKLIFSMIIVAAVPLIIAVTLSYITSTRKAKVDAIDRLEWQAWYVESEISAIMQNNKASIAAFAESPLTIQYMRGEEVDDKQILEQMNAINEEIGDGNEMVLTAANGQQLLRTDGGTLLDITDREYFQEALKGEFNVSNIIVSNSSGVRMICFAGPIVDSDTNKVIGVVHRSYRLDDYHTLLDEEADEAFMVDRNGDLAAHSDYIINPEDAVQNFSNSEYMTSGK